MNTDEHRSNNQYEGCRGRPPLHSGLICVHLCSSVAVVRVAQRRMPADESVAALTPEAGAGAAAGAGVLLGGLAWSKRMSFWALLFMRTSNWATQALNRTWVNTSGMAVTRPRAVANRASPMAPAEAVTSPPLDDWMALNVPIMLMTVPSRPTMVAILAMARMGGSRKFRSGRISSSISFAIARRIAAVPCFADCRPAT